MSSFLWSSGEGIAPDELSSPIFQIFFNIPMCSYGPNLLCYLQATFFTFRNKLLFCALWVTPDSWYCLHVHQVIL